MSIHGKVMVGLSGGVDSAVAALLLQQQGWEVEALFMKNWEEDDSEEYCSAAEDLADATAVAEQLGIRLHTANFSAEYWDRVFSYFLDEYRAGRTPNPDVLCNREIKFRAFLDHAMELGAGHIATGHYARVASDKGQYLLELCADQNKDQTYFLYMLNQHQLSHALFPLAEYTKQQVRTLAREAGFVNHQKKDSTGICFIGERRFREFLQRYLPASPGDMVTPEGELVGRHVGLMYYTLGQRKGLGIGGRKGASEASWFVVEKDLAANRLIVAQDHEHPLLMKRGMVVSDLHWVAGKLERTLPFACSMRIRHRQELQTCHLIKIEKDQCHVKFDRLQRAVTPGQAAVFYADDLCLGGGTILHSESDIA